MSRETEKDMKQLMQYMEGHCIAAAPAGRR